MKKLKTYKRLLGLLLAPILLFAAPAASAQTDAASDSAKVKEGWWTIGAEVANNSSFFGRNTATRYPYAAASLTYVHRTGIWASVTSYQLFNTETYIDETDLSMGYSFKIRDLVEANVSYSRFIFGKNTPLVNAFTSNALSAKAALDWGILYTGLTSSYVFGDNNDIFTVLENSRFVPLNPLWGGRRVIGLDPKVTITAGTQRFYETHTTTTTNKNQTGLPTSGGSTGGDPLGGVLDPLKPGGGKPKDPDNSDGSTTTTTTTTAHSKFNVLNYELKLPVVIYLGNFELEPAYKYSIPVNKIEGDESKPQSFYSFNISYTF